MSAPFLELPPNLPVPTDDGGADHLQNARFPDDIALPATTGGLVRLADLDRTVIFTYPRTGTPDHPPGADWDAIPGARGCTPHSCGFRDLRKEFELLGIQVLGLSTQTTEFQQEFATRNHFPFPILSDEKLELVKRMNLPTFDYNVATLGGGGPDTLIKRMAWYIENGVIEEIWYPVFPPTTNAENVLAWLRRERPTNAGTI
jgi:peroxiredoxin